MKKKQFDSLLLEMGHCGKCSCLKSNKGKDCSLINIYQEENFAKSIPSIWTDWYHRLDAKIFVIGQDWGPYFDMQRLCDDYNLNPTDDNWKKLIENEKSLTKRQLTKYFVDSSDGKYSSIDSVFFTNAIMCARGGNHYRDNNIQLKYSTISCSQYLKRQIEIVRPKVILTLGYYPLLALSHIYSFPIQDTLQKCICETPVILFDDFVVIPLYHPAAQIRKETQMEQYRRIWEYL